MAETTTGMMYTKSFNFSSDEFKMPEDLGKRAGLALLDEIFNGGVVDSDN